MAWFLVLLGLLLIGLGWWGTRTMETGGGHQRRAPEPDKPRPSGPMTQDEAWNELTRPFEPREELIGLPRPQRRPGFQHGLLTGLGAGLIIAGLAVHLFPRTVEPSLPPVASNQRPDVVSRSERPAQPTPAAGQTPATPAPGSAATPAPAPAPAPGTATPGAAPAPAAAGPANITFTVDPGELAPDIAAKLKAAGLISDEAAFLGRVQERGVDTLLKAGTFIVPTGATVDQVIDALTA